MQTNLYVYNILSTDIASYVATLLDIVNTLGYFTSLKPTWPLQLKFAYYSYVTASVLRHSIEWI